MFANNEKLMQSIWHQFDIKVNNLQLEEYLIKENEILKHRGIKEDDQLWYRSRINSVSLNEMQFAFPHSPLKNETFSYLRFSLF